jgi:hypothetical protein
MEELLRKYRIRAVWHFTARSNWPLIAEHGLLSLAELHRRGIEVPAPGGNDWSHEADRIKGLHEYVHLAFTTSHPMLYRAREEGRIADPIWIQIDPSILLQDGVKFCTDVSNKAGVPILEPADAIEQIDFDALFTYMNWADPEIRARRLAAEKSEVLVPRKVSIHKIIGHKNG